jgi:hypothetical protein
MYNYQVSNLTNDAAVSVQGEERLHAAIHKLLDAGLNVRDIGIVLEDAEATDDEETILAAIDARILANEGGNPVVNTRAEATFQIQRVSMGSSGMMRSTKLF